MSMGYIRQFNELDKDDASIAGGKGASLGEMTKANLPIPSGFVIVAQAFEQFLQETDLNVEIDSILHIVDQEKMHTVESASEQIKELILRAQMPRELGVEIMASFKKLDTSYVAVRSSATSEDSANAAWAGQLDSYLNTTKKTLLENVKRCWASLFTPRAIFYRFEKCLHQEKISVAVIIQKMIASEVSGIAFSVHPVTQDYNQLIIEAGYGLGEAIVSGQITPDSYVVEKEPRRIIDKNLSEQERTLVREEKGDNIWIELPKEKSTKQKLSDTQILKLSKLILHIEQHYGFPCDIEWALEDEKFFILQSRPITTLNASKIPSVGEKLEVNANTNSIQILKRRNEDPKASVDPLKYFFLENVPGGYPMDVAYINLWHLAGPKLAGFDFDAGSMFLVFEDGHYELFIEKESWFGAAHKILEHILTDDTRVHAWESRIKKWIIDIMKTNKYYSHLDFESLSDQALFKQLDAIIDFIKRNGKEDVEIVTTNYGTNLIAEKLTATLRELGFDAAKTAPILFRASEDFPLLQYEQKIGELALLCYRKKITALTDVIAKKDEEMRVAINTLLKKYAWLDASIVNPPKSQESVLQDVNSLLVFGAQLEKILQEREQEQEAGRNEKAKLVKECLSKASSEQKRIINFAIKSAELGRTVVDEIMQFIYHSRRVYPQLAKRISISEIDLRLLLRDEIWEHLLNKKKVTVKEIEERRRLCVCFLDNQKVTVYSGQKADQLKHSLSALKQGDNSPLKGEIAFSKGIVKGRARLVKNHEEMSKVEKGNILVSSRTYPDLLPAMKRSIAIIAELGGLLSHAAIVSRELHIPCLVGVKNAMSKIKDGDLLEVNTEKGTITILDTEKIHLRTLRGFSPE